jgi:hypothetical protein
MLLAPPLAAADWLRRRASAFRTGYASLVVGDQGVDVRVAGVEIAEGLHEQDKRGLREICVKQLRFVLRRKVKTDAPVNGCSVPAASINQVSENWRIGSLTDCPAAALPRPRCFSTGAWRVQYAGVSSHRNPLKLILALPEASPSSRLGRLDRPRLHLYFW